MSTDELKQQIIDAITAGKIQATTINIGDHVEHQHNIGNVETGGIGVQILQSAHEEPKPQEQQDYCIYICREKLQEQGIYTLDEFEQMMANASKGIASDFASFLKRYKAQGILNFMGHSKKQIFDYFRAHYPEMRAYDYPNFAAAY